MQSKDNWNRRDFMRNVGALGMASTYSLVVRAPAAAASTLPFASPDFEALAPAEDLTERIAAEANMTVVSLECDFLVAGGGMAGVCAALAAARNGARVILVQNRSRLGGNASSEVRMHIVGADHHGHRSGWREGGILEELRIEDAVTNPNWSWELWDLLLYDKIISETNITLLLDTDIYGAAVKDERITEALARCDSTEHIYRIKANYYADCTGDCRLGLEAGAKFRTGHESRDAWNESLAPETAGPETLGSSILFTSKQYDHPVPFVPPRWARKITKEHLQKRSVHAWEYGYWWIEWGGMRNAIRDNEQIRFELLSIVMGVWDYIKNSGDCPESADWGMDWIGMIPGKRSSRRLIGAHTLTQNEMIKGNDTFDDAVAIGGWPFDNHTPGGFDDPETSPCDSVKIEEVYNIPLRALYSGNIQNLFMAGRNISASHVAFTSTRVMATCSVEGQAIGTAAAMCLQHTCMPQHLYENKVLLQGLQQRLLRDDQTLKDIHNEDADDLARQATKVHASGEVEGSKAAHVINGHVRDMTGEWKNRWGAPMTDTGAWLELNWNTAQPIAQVQLCFDSGFSRQLSLTGQYSTRKNQKRSTQPETVREYRLLYRDNTAGNWKEIVSVTGNYQRLRRHTFAPLQIIALRLEITATNGNPEARVYEIRCYGATGQ